MKIKNLICSAFVVILVLFLSVAYADELSKDILVSNAWVQVMPPSQTTSAAYMMITNNSSKEAVLLSATSEIADSVEIHQMSEMNGMMNMAMVSSVHILAHDKVILQPGGFHLMLINLKKPLNKGDIVSIALHFQGGSDIVVNAEAKAELSEESSSMPGMKM